MNRALRQVIVGGTGVLLGAAVMSCNGIDVTRPRLTLRQLTVGAPVIDTVARGSARVYSVGVSAGTLYRVAITGLTDDVDLYVFGADSTFSSLVGCLIDRTVLFNTTPENCTLLAQYKTMYIGVDATYVGGASASYTIDVEPVTSSKRLTLSTPIPDSVASGGDTLYSVAVALGTSYTIAITGLTDSLVGLNVANGAQVLTSFPRNSPKDFTVSAGDTVQYFAVDGFNVAAGGTGHFVITATPAPVVVTPIVATSGSVPGATPTIGWVVPSAPSQYHTDGLTVNSHTVSIVGLTAAATLHVYTDVNYTMEAICTSENPGARECVVSGPSAYFTVAAGPTNAVGAGYVMLVW